MSGENRSHPKCYLRDLNCCSQKITAEHFISHAALRVLAEKKIDVSGFPWMQEGESRSVSFESLTVKRLCAAHNNALSPLDAVAGIFFHAIKECGTNSVGPPRKHLFSGHDIDRWFLKTLAGVASSRNLMSNKERLDGALHESINLAALLENPSWDGDAKLTETGMAHDDIEIIATTPPGRWHMPCSRGMVAA